MVKMSITQLRRGEIYPWSKMEDYPIQMLIRTNMSRSEMIEWLEVNKPVEMEKFFKEMEGHFNEN